MNINWKIRLRNKVWLTSFAAAAAAFAYEVMQLLGFTPKVEMETVLQGVSALLTLLTALGVVMDPTTPGVKDSERAMTYGKESLDRH